MQNIISIGASALSMTSLEISALVQTQHQNVRISIERLAKKGVIQLPPMQLVENKQSLSQNNKTNVYIFTGHQGKRDSLIVVAQLCPEFTAKIVDRWQELEHQGVLAKFNLPSSYPEAMRLAADLADQKAAVESRLAIAAPKAEALDRIADADGTMNPTVAAKVLQVQPKKLFDFLRSNHWIYRRPGGSGNVAYQDKIQAGYLTHKTTTVEREDGSEKVVEQVLITGKGLVKLSQSFGGVAA